MNRPLLSGLAVFALFAVTPLLAGQAVSDSKKVMKEPCPPDTVTYAILDSSYTADSDFERGDDAHGSSIFNSLEVNRRFLLGPGWPNQECGNWYLRAGLQYSRWDFDNSGGLPIPNTLQSAAGIIALEYVVNDAPVMMIEAQPGVYFQHDIDADDIDVPVKIYAPIFVRQGENSSFAIVAGLTHVGFRTYPLLPVAGVIWRKDKITLFGVVPEPRLIYSARPGLDFWISGELAGGSFRTDGNRYEKKPALNEAVVTYSEYRAAAGVAWKKDNLVVDIGAGWAFQRKFDYHRAEEGFETDGGAPFVKVELRAGF